MRFKTVLATLASLLATSCLPNFELPTREVCNGIDDDRDGVIDNLPSNTGLQTCGYGRCTFMLSTCSMGRPQTCPPVILGVPEVCANGIDDNCNGRIDEANCTSGALWSYVITAGRRTASAGDGGTSITPLEVPPTLVIPDATSATGLAYYTCYNTRSSRAQRTNSDQRTGPGIYLCETDRFLPRFRWVLTDGRCKDVNCNTLRAHTGDGEGDVSSCRLLDDADSGVVVEGVRAFVRPAEQARMGFAYDNNRCFMTATPHQPPPDAGTSDASTDGG